MATTVGPVRQAHVDGNVAIEVEDHARDLLSDAGLDGLVEKAAHGRIDEDLVGSRERIGTIVRETPVQELVRVDEALHLIARVEHDGVELDAIPAGGGGQGTGPPCS